MTYDEAIDLLRKNPFNIQLVDSKLIDLRMLRFLRRFHRGSGAWAVTYPCVPKSLKDNVRIWCDHIVNFQNEFGWEDIPLDEGAK